MSSLTDFEGDVEKALARLAAKTSFCDVMVEQGTGSAVSTDSKATNVAAVPRMRGAAFRAWAGKYWVEASTSDLSSSALGSTIELLERSLSHASSTSHPPGTAATTRAERATRPGKPVAEMGTEAMLKVVTEARDWALTVPSIGEAQVRLSWGDESRLYLNSAGARCLQTVSRVHYVVVPIAIEHGKAEVDYLIRGGEGGQELLQGLTEENVLETARNSKALLSAKSPPAGEMAVLLDPTVSGLFAHESFGHGTEADQFTRDRSYLKPILGSEVGPSYLSISDDGAFAGAWGSIFFDDEGHPGQKNKLVDAGRFTGALHDRETAAAFATRPTGNTRRSDFLSRAFVRMTNTYVEPGPLSFDELLAETKNGILLEHGSSGIEDPLGGQMQLKVTKGHLIENGKLTDLVGSMALSGSVLRFLREIRGVGRANGTLVIEPGFCGKGHSDYIPVGTGGVHLLSRAVVGPA